MTRSTSALGLTLAVVVLAASPASAQPIQLSTLKRLSLEELMAVDVTTVSRRTERAVDAAAAVSVITGEDIRRSGASTLADALRLADGLYVGRFNTGTWTISSRGFATNVNNKLLVLIDGRSVYTQLFGGVFWDMQDTMLADVSRIEVIRGPAGTLWGPNAFSGVINVITRPAAETQGGLLRLGAGREERGYGALRYGGRAGSGHYRVYARSTYFDSPLLQDGSDPREDRRMHQAGVRVDLATPGQGQFTLSGDAYYGRMGLQDRPDLSYAGGNVLAQWARPLSGGSAVQMRAYLDRTHRDVPRQSFEDRTTVEVDLQHEWRAAARHHVVWGGAARLSADSTRATQLLFFDPADRTLYLLNAFAQDEIALRPGRVFVTVGAKVDGGTLSRLEVQPSGRLRVKLSDRQTLWGAASRAVRTPTRFDQDLRITVSNVVVIRGDRAFDTEKQSAYELGYRIRPWPRVSFDAAAFYSRYDDLRSQEPTPPFGFPIVIANKMRGTGAGLELRTTLHPVERWLIDASYALVDLSVRFDADSRDPTRGANEANDPRHQFALHSYVNLPGNVELDAFVRQISSLPNPPVDGYAELDLRLGWRPRERLELSVIGRDLAHDRHGEFRSPGLAQIREFQRDIAGRVTWRF